MADTVFTTTPVTFNEIAFSGGLNSTAGPFAVSNSESPDLQNVEFTIFGSIGKVPGYYELTTAALGVFNSDGLYWFEYISSGTTTRKLINVADGKFYKMDTASSGEPDGTWDDATNSKTITADNFCDFVTWHNKVFMVNGYDTPLVWDGAGITSLTTATLPTGVTKPKYIEQFQNYLFYLNVYVSSAKEGSRFYWCALNDETTWSATSFIRVSDNDGTEISGAAVLSDRLVVFKERSIYNVYPTFDPDIPFTVQKSNSSVGCVCAYSIQEVENGLVFLSQDGFYFYDGNNSYKLSDKVSETIKDYTLSSARSVVNKKKSQYRCALTDSSNNDVVMMWDYFNNAWTKRTGLNASAMARVFINGTEERNYFTDYAGYCYRMDYGLNDRPLGVDTAINAYYYTNWKPFSDLIIQKSVPKVVIYHQLTDGDLTFVYSYDFEETDQYAETFSMQGDDLVWDEGNWDEETWQGSGGKAKRIDLTGRGRVVRMGFKNSALNETFRVDGLGIYVEGETDV